MSSIATLAAIDNIIYWASILMTSSNNDSAKMNSTIEVPDWSTIPAQVDDGAARHLVGMRIHPSRLAHLIRNIIRCSRGLNPRI